MTVDRVPGHLYIEASEINCRHIEQSKSKSQDLKLVSVVVDQVRQEQILMQASQGVRTSYMIKNY